MKKGNPNGRAHSIVTGHCDYMANLSGRRKYARQKALDFAIAHGLIEYEKINTGSSLPNENIKIVRCFGRHFDKRDAPETITADTAKTHIWNFKDD